MPCPVLVVEDDPDVREMMAMLLTMEGFEPTTAANGREALDQLLAGLHPHVIVLDLMMPIMDGFQFREAQRRDPLLADIPVIVVTALSAASACRTHADAIIPKPVDYDRLIATVQAHC